MFFSSKNNPFKNCFEVKKYYQFLALCVVPRFHVPRLDMILKFQLVRRRIRLRTQTAFVYLNSKEKQFCITLI